MSYSLKSINAVTEAFIRSRDRIIRDALCKHGLLPLAVDVPEFIYAEAVRVRVKLERDLEGTERLLLDGKPILEFTTPTIAVKYDETACTFGVEVVQPFREMP